MRFVLLCICAIRCIPLNAQDSVYANASNFPFIRTVEMRRTDLSLAPPAVEINSGDQLRLAFDDLTGVVKSYYYTFVHCNRDWTASGLQYYEFMDGFEENNIADYAYSFATSTKYVHYTLDFPNRDVTFKISGNYVIQVWDENNDSIPVLTRRFYVFENLVPINAEIVRPNVVAHRTEFQKIEFALDLKGVSVQNPFELIGVNVLQNGIAQQGLYDLKPRIIQNDQMLYDDINLVFPAMKEYRRFDTRSLKFQTDRILKIERRPEIINAFINIDASRAYKQYFYEKDMNGNFVIMADLTNDPSVEADYAMMHFTLEYPYWLNNGNFYVVGAFNDYKISRENEMQYDFDKQQYSCRIFLKQGYYNYMYVFIPNTGSAFDFSYAEGNYFETENEYTVFVYLHSNERDYDTLIGYKNLNSYK